MSARKSKNKGAIIGQTGLYIICFIHPTRQNETCTKKNSCRKYHPLDFTSVALLPCTPAWLTTKLLPFRTATPERYRYLISREGAGGGITQRSHHTFKLAVIIKLYKRLRTTQSTRQQRPPGENFSQEPNQSVGIGVKTPPQLLLPSIHTTSQSAVCFLSEVALTRNRKIHAAPH